MDPISDVTRRQRTTELVVQFGVDPDTASGRAFVESAIDGVPLDLPEPPAPRPAAAPAEPDVATAVAQRLGLTLAPSPAATWPPG